MTDPHHTDAHGDHGASVRTYLVVFVALAVFTAVSFGAYGMFPRNISFWIILAVAIVKAVLVGAYFMHLLFDWRRVGFMLIPAFILGTMLVFVLLPDFVLAWRSPEVETTSQR